MVLSSLPAAARAIARRLAAFGCAAGLAGGGAIAAASPLPLVAGPGDLMRALPPGLARQFSPSPIGRGAAPDWNAQLAGVATLLRRLDRPTTGAAATVLDGMPQPFPAPLRAALRKVVVRSRDVEWLRFSPTPRDGAVVGASFVGPTGSAVVMVNRSRHAVRVELGSWVRSNAPLAVYALPAPASGVASARVAPGGVVLPARSVVIAG